MDMGKAIEFDIPHNLLQKRVGVFKDMVLALGTQEANRLMKLAQTQFDKLNQQMWFIKIIYFIFIIS